MRISNAFRISIANFGLVFKNLLYKIIVFALFIATVSLTLNIGLKPLTGYIADILHEIKSVFLSVFSGGITLSAIRETFGKLMEYLSSHIGDIVLTGVILVLITYVFMFLGGISDCVLTILIREYMTSVSHLSFMRVLIENLKRIVVYQLISALINILCDAFIMFFAILFISLTYSFMPILSIFFGIAILVAFYALMQTITGQMTAHYFTENAKIGESIKKAFKTDKASFGKMYACYVTVILAMFYLMISVTVFTFGVGMVLLVPICSLLLVSIKEVDYFTINKRKYFIDYDNIVVPKELRDNDEKLLNDIEI